MFKKNHKTDGELQQSHRLLKSQRKISELKNIITEIKNSVV